MIVVVILSIVVVILVGIIAIKNEQNNILQNKVDTYKIIANSAYKFPTAPDVPKYTLFTRALFPITVSTNLQDCISYCHGDFYVFKIVNNTVSKIYKIKDGKIHSENEF
jgi:hypothetical protein